MDLTVSYKVFGFDCYQCRTRKKFYLWVWRTEWVWSVRCPWHSARVPRVWDVSPIFSYGRCTAHTVINMIGMGIFGINFYGYWTDRLKLIELIDLVLQATVSLLKYKPNDTAASKSYSTISRGCTSLFRTFCGRIANTSLACLKTDSFYLALHDISLSI